ncbi:unnamed protein product [Schistocephalus solidus]|uniref:OCIA domain-containing protein n=1 Tax=Schistocephalus solidus TaxID=70667 RepID=A0A183TDP6_SCHSO|nr:unnamed protein product [Schistocephalus solidus]
MASREDLTYEDIATFKRCRKESFWGGCVPMTIGATLVVAVAQSSGFFLNRPRMRVPAYFLAVVCGYLGGKISYIGKCKRMFLDLDNSRVKDMLLGNASDTLNGLPGRGSLGEGPIAVQTPIDDGKQLRQPMTYAQRREYFRNHAAPYKSPSQPSPTPPSTPQSLSRNPEETYQDPYAAPAEAPAVQEPQTDTRRSDAQSPYAYFDQDRPLSSYFSEDAYRPRD